MAGVLPSVSARKTAAAGTPIPGTGGGDRAREGGAARQGLDTVGDIGPLSVQGDEPGGPGGAGPPRPRRCRPPSRSASSGPRRPAGPRRHGAGLRASSAWHRYVPCRPSSVRWGWARPLWPPGPRRGPGGVPGRPRGRGGVWVVQAPDAALGLGRPGAPGPGPDPAGIVRDAASSSAAVTSRRVWGMVRAAWAMTAASRLSVLALPGVRSAMRRIDTPRQVAHRDARVSGNRHAPGAPMVAGWSTTTSRRPCSPRRLYRSRSRDSLLGRTLSNSVLPALSRAVAQCSALPTSMPMKTSISLIDIVTRSSPRLPGPGPAIRRPTPHPRMR